MKIKFLLIITLLLLPASITFSHKQHTHQYITIQAYIKLLERALLLGYPEMISHLGNFEDDIGSGPWQLGKITTGAWREDEEDVVYGYEDEFFPTDGGAISATHFWDTDDGDLLLGHITGYLNGPTWVSCNYEGYIGNTLRNQFT